LYREFVSEREKARGGVLDKLWGIEKKGYISIC
jgi:hypothetical protein